MTTLSIDHVWQSTVLAFAAWALAMALRNHEARVRYWIWLAASIKFLVPFAVLGAIGSQLDWLTTAAPVQPIELGWRAFAQPMTALGTSTEPAASGSAPDDRVAAVSMLAIVWITGVVAVLGHWFARWVRLSRLVRSATPLALPRLAELGIDARLSPSKIEPGVVGIFRPVLLLPDGILQRLSAQQLDAVIAHELCHVRRRDNLTAAVHMVVQAVFWFHPLVWWIGARLVEERERACDEAVVASGVDPGTYAQGIVDVCRFYVESPLPCAAGVGAGTSLQDRVRRIAAPWTARRLSGAWTSSLAAAALVMIGAPIVIGAVTAPSALAQAAPTTSPKFVSVMIEEGDNEGSPGYLRMGGLTFETRDVMLRRLVAFAHDLQDHEIAGPPELDSRAYTIAAEVQSASAPVFGHEWHGITLALLERRFGLEGHREIAEVDALVLARAASTSPLDLASAGSNGMMIRIREDGLELSNLPLRVLTDWLSTSYGKPIVDETGLNGIYSFNLRWELAPAGVPPPQSVLARALEEQLGLSLKEEPRSVERFVVDRIEEPTAQ